jgi:hypothetical protein
MSDYAVNIDLPDYKLGDVWLGIQQIGPITDDNEDPIGGTLERMTAEFTHSSGARFLLDSDEENESRNGSIVIEDAAEWQATIPEQSFLPMAGYWSWKIKAYGSETPQPLTCYDGVATVHQ